MEINISKIAKTLENEHSHTTTQLLMMLINKDKDRYFTPTYADLVKELRPLAFNLGLDLDEILIKSHREEAVYDSESFVIASPTFREYLMADIHLQKEVAKKYGWSDDDGEPSWMNTAEYIYNVHYKPTFSRDEEWENRE